MTISGLGIRHLLWMRVVCMFFQVSLRSLMIKFIIYLWITHLLKKKYICFIVSINVKHQWSLFAVAPIIIFSNIKTVVLNVTLSCFQPHCVDRPFFFFRVNLFPCAVFQYFLHPLPVWLGDMATVLSTTILHCQEAHRVTWKKLLQILYILWDNYRFTCLSKKSFYSPVSLSVIALEPDLKMQTIPNTCS